MSEVKREVKPCGCVITTMPDGSTNYEPCLVHALETAGTMLVAAARRLAQAAQQMPAEEANKDPDDTSD